jgi:hypothetical protein
MDGERGERKRHMGGEVRRGGGLERDTEGLGGGGMRKERELGWN